MVIRGSTVVDVDGDLKSRELVVVQSFAAELNRLVPRKIKDCYRRNAFTAWSAVGWSRNEVSNFTSRSGKTELCSETS